KIEKAAQILEMRTRLPSTAEQPENSRLRGSQIFRADGAQGSNAHFLNDAIGHDRDRLNAFDVEQDDEPTVSVPGSNGQDPPALDPCGERVAGHIGSDSKSPDAGAGTAAFLRLESISKSRVGFRFDRQVDLTARPIESSAFRELAINVFCRRDRALGSQRF